MRGVATASAVLPPLSDTRNSLVRVLQVECIDRSLFTCLVRVDWSTPAVYCDDNVACCWRDPFGDAGRASLPPCLLNRDSRVCGKIDFSGRAMHRVFAVPLVQWKESSCDFCETVSSCPLDQTLCGHPWVVGAWP